VHERNPHEGHPEEGLKRAGPVGDEIRGVLAGIDARVGEEPADVGVDEAAGQPASAGAEPLWRVRIAVCVRELMMLVMIRDSVHHSAFDGEAVRWQTAGSAICPGQVHGTYDVGRVLYRERPM